MTDTTTIEITHEQKAQLDDRKRADSESYKGVLQRLIEGHSDEPELTESRVQEIARAEVRDVVRMEALE